MRSVRVQAVVGDEGRQRRVPARGVGVVELGAQAAAADMRRRKSSAVVELVDLYPTLADLAGLEPPPHVRGRSLRAQLEDPDAPGRDSALTTFITHDRLHPDRPHRPKEQSYSLRTEHWRYTEWGRDGRQGVELYDHRNDPKEFTNLADDPAYRDTLKRLEDLMATRIAAARRKPTF